MEDDGLRQAAVVNPSDKFALVFKQMVESLFLERMDQNEDIFIRYMNDPSFQNAVTDWMATETYRKLREEDTGAPESTDPALPAVLRLVEPTRDERFVTCVPLVPLKAAAGTFGAPKRVEEGDWQWVALEARVDPAPDLFVAQLVGESMNRRIPNGAWCLWRVNPAGTRNGRVVLAEHHSINDPELGGSYTVKIYESEKQAAEGSWRHRQVRLMPDSLDGTFEPLVFDETSAGQLRIVAELVEILSGTDKAN